MLPFLISERFWRRQQKREREVRKGSEGWLTWVVDEGGLGTR